MKTWSFLTVPHENHCLTFCAECDLDHLQTCHGWSKSRERAKMARQVGGEDFEHVLEATHQYFHTKKREYLRLDKLGAWVDAYLEEGI